MIHSIREAFNELLAENHWMDDETRAVAKEKADAMNERIGYPKLITNKEELEKEYDSVSIKSLSDLAHDQTSRIISDIKLNVLKIMNGLD